MTPREAVDLAGRWPGDRTVPRKLRAAYDEARGVERQQIKSLVEVLKVASGGQADYELIDKYFAD